MGKINSRSKGARYERELARYLSENGYPDSRRGQQFSGGSDSPDVVSDFPFHIEAKHVQALNLQNAFDQATRDAGDKPPCVIHRKNNSPSMFTCKLDDLIKLLNEKSWTSTNTKIL